MNGDLGSAFPILFPVLSHSLSLLHLSSQTKHVVMLGTASVSWAVVPSLLFRKMGSWDIKVLVGVAQTSEEAGGQMPRRADGTRHFFRG